MSLRTRVPIVLLLFSLAGCDFSCDRRELSDAGQYWLIPSTFDVLGEDSRSVLVGTEFDVQIEMLAVEGEVDPDQGGLECATQSGSGVAEEIEENWFRVSAAGEGAIEFAPPVEACPANTDVLIELGPDSWSFVGVDADQVVPWWIASADSDVIAGWNSPGPANAWPDGVGELLDELLVVENSYSSAYPVLIQPALGPRAEVRYGQDAMPLGPEVFLRSFHTDERDGVPLPPDVEFEATVLLSQHQFTMPPLRTVPLSAVRELELVPVYDRSDSPEREWGPPRNVTAIGRDAEGRRVVSLPVEWSLLEGNLAASFDEPHEILELRDVCSKRPKKPRADAALIEARLGELVETVELEWTALPEDERNYRDEDCVSSGCQCAVTPSSKSVLWTVFALLSLGVVRRRVPRAR